MRWSLFCRVIDNYGDAGFCLRLARELQAHGEQVELFIDDARPLAWMQAAGVPVQPWPDDAAQPRLGEVVIEAFGCELPPGVLARIAATRPLWINLEYLSAEAYVERSHGLPSPQMGGPAAGCVKRFCYPGFTAGTGGLLCEAGLDSAWRAHDASAWWQRMGLEPQPGERQVSLFAYPDAPLAALLAALADAPTRLLVSPGLQLPETPPGLRVQPLPWLSQADYDRLLWSCDLNLVRGEDSFVRAQWAGRPFLWHIYRQQDGAHRAKLEAFLRLHGGDPTPWRAWIEADSPALPIAALFSDTARQHALAWRERLLRGPELVTTLLSWATGKA
jgi:uncharacterized repeat protein (TIGR03837 family)